MFPFIPGGRDLRIDKLAIVFGLACDAPCGCAGVFGTCLRRLADDGRRTEFELRFPGDTGRLDRMFLLCRYRAYPDRLARDTETKGEGARDGWT